MKRFAYRAVPIVFFGWLLVASLVSGTTRGQAPDAKNQQQNSTPCIECISIRVGPPTVLQGPGPGIPDNPFNEIRLPNGRFRGFSASATTYAIDGATPADMDGRPVPVLPKGPRGQYGDSGQWINHVEWSGNTLLGWAHCETGDRPGMGLQSMALVASENDGLSWRRMGEIITGRQPLIQGRITGEANCTIVNGHDGYYYAYCWRNGTGHGDGATTVARAPVSDPRPGNWKKYFNGGWSQPGLGGESTGLAKGVGGSVSRWTTTGQILLLGKTPGGIGLQFSTDGINFTGLREPIMDGGGGSWHPRNPLEIVSYQDLLDAQTGGNQLSNSWIMAYLYVQPNEGMNKRYLVIRPVDVTVSNSPVTPQVGVLLARWYNPGLHDRWSTTAAVPAVNGSAYKLEAKSGYLMTAADPKQPTIELEDCLSPPGQPLVHILMQKTPRGHVCEDHGYQRSRTAGFLYTAAQPGTQPLYSCYSESEKSHFAANSEDCDHLGKQETLLGYDLKE